MLQERLVGGDPVPHVMEDRILLGAEVAEEGARGVVGGLSDFLDGRLGESPLLEQADGRRGELPAGTQQPAAPGRPRQVSRLRNDSVFRHDSDYRQMILSHKQRSSRGVERWQTVG
jgi:hypothetical protein